MTVRVEGKAELQANLARLAKRYGDSTAKAALAGAQLVRSTAIKSIQSQSVGDTVTRYREGASEGYDHVSSAPGDPPNTDTGRLVSSIFVEVRPDEVFVGSSLPYAAHLEFGTRRMDARPWLVPALESRRRDIDRLFQKAIEKTSRT